VADHRSVIGHGTFFDSADKAMRIAPRQTRAAGSGETAAKIFPERSQRPFLGRPILEKCRFYRDKLAIFPANIRFTPESGHSPTRSGCLLWANRRHSLSYSITSSSEADMAL
jgi:hypothetical protein